MFVNNYLFCHLTVTSKDENLIFYESEIKLVLFLNTYIIADCSYFFC